MTKDEYIYGDDLPCLDCGMTRRLRFDGLCRQCVLKRLERDSNESQIMNKTAKCPICGATFARHRNKLYCSPQCCAHATNLARRVHKKTGTT